jgi:hypothetical protein
MTEDILTTCIFQSSDSIPAMLCGGISMEEFCIFITQSCPFNITSLFLV